MDIQKKRAVCLMSGGLDSAVVAALLHSQRYELYFLAVDYGQKVQNKELACVEQLSKFYAATRLEILDLTWLGRFRPAGLTASDIYLSSNSAKLEYVPFRNTLLLSAGIAWAEALAAERVGIGSIRGPWLTSDKRPEYVAAMQEVAALGTQLKTDIRLYVPFEHSKKVEVVSTGLELQAPFELTWSCPNRQDKACGECSNCQERRAAFQALGATDPIPYIQQVFDLPHAVEIA